MFIINFCGFACFSRALARLGSGVAVFCFPIANESATLMRLIGSPVKSEIAASFHEAAR